MLKQHPLNTFQMPLFQQKKNRTWHYSEMFIWYVRFADISQNSYAQSLQFVGSKHLWKTTECWVKTYFTDWFCLVSCVWLQILLSCKFHGLPKFFPPGLLLKKRCFVFYFIKKSGRTVLADIKTVFVKECTW